MIKIFKYGEVENNKIFDRCDLQSNVSEIVTEIIENVKKNGDKAVIEYGKKFDNANIETLLVSQKEIDDAFNKVDKEFIDIIVEASENIKNFHSKQIRNGFIINEKDGVVLGQKVLPIEKVGIYVPGGTASYPSTVLMDTIPAKIAGCEQIIMTTPVKESGLVAPEILVSAKIAGVDKIFKTGGAQAIGALAYGTESIPKVDKIVGPGNAFVAEAKRQVFGKVSIDMIAGPSEILIVADNSCNPKFVASDMLSQAEHDKNASAVLVTNNYDFAKKVSEELEKQIPLLNRKEIARASIDNNGKIIVAQDILVAIDIANEIAPEHLEICLDNPFDYLSKIKNAGSVFLGKNCPEALGDYFAGPNHTLPTSGTARFSSPLNVEDFIKTMQFTYYSKQALQKVNKKIDYFANKEGLQGHGKSATVRFEEDE